jgi:tripartite-type tricarboxylate transporter receptor subunit TctC
VRTKLLLAVACLSLIGSSARATDEVERFYAGKNIEMLIGYGAGGGFDMWARAVAQHMGRHIPGKPTIISRNMPGAGSLAATNYLYNVAPKDGTSIGLIGRGVLFEPLFGGEGVKFDPLQFNYLGNPSRDYYMCALWHTHPAKTAHDLFEKETKLGSTGSGSESHVFPLMLKNLLGMPAKPIVGYKGSNEILLGIERQELDGICLGTETVTRTSQYRDGKYKILLQIGSAPDPTLPGVPLITELAKPKDKPVLDLIFSRFDVGRPFVAPPGVPATRVAALQAAFAETMKDPAFKEDVARVNLQINATTGEEIIGLLRKAYKTPPEIVRRTAEILGQ